MTGGGPASDAEAFAAKKQAAVTKAESAVCQATDQLRDALKKYEFEVEAHEQRGDGFFSGAYIVARKEAVLARKFFESKTAALNTARAEADTPTLGLGGIES